MLKKFRQIPDSIIYLSSSLINSVVSFFSLPIFLIYLSKEDMGYFATFKIYSDILTVIVTFNSTQLIYNKYYRNKQDKNLIFSSVLLISGIVFLCLLVVSIYLRSYIAIALKIDSVWVPIFTFYSGLNFLQLLWLHSFQALLKPLKFALIQVSMGLSSILFGLFFVIKFSLGWQGRFYGALSSASLIIFFALIIFLLKANKIKITLKKQTLKEIIRFGIPLFPRALGEFIVKSIDRLYLIHFIGIGALGIYTVGFSIANVFNMLSIAINRSFMPDLFKVLDSNQTNAKINSVKMIYKKDLFFILTCIFGCFSSFFLFRWVIIKNEFAEALIFVYWLLPAFALAGMIQIRFNLIIYTKKTKLALWSSDSLAAGLNILLCPVFIYWNGAIGAAQSTFISYFIATPISWYAAHLSVPLPWFQLRPENAKQ